MAKKEDKYSEEYHIIDVYGDLYYGSFITVEEVNKQLKVILADRICDIDEVKNRFIVVRGIYMDFKITEPSITI
jgi:hypothetical protein